MERYSFIKTLIEPWGKLKPQLASDWREIMTLPDAIVQFYARVGPWGETVYEHVGPVGLTINIGGNPVCIPPLHKLWGLQMGYRVNSVTHVPIADWNPSWLVIAEEGGNPFIFDCVQRTVLFAFHGTGCWSPKLLAEDLLTAIGGIATVANSLADLGENAYDEEFNLMSDSRLYVVDKLGCFLGGKSEAEKFLHVLEWYE